MNQNKDNITSEIKDIIEEKLLVDISQLENDDNLKETLGIDLELDLPLLTSDIVKKYNISLEAEEALNQTTTLHQLVNIVIEETELG
jgi:acyl carrier protein